MTLPARVFVIVLETDSPRDPDRMPLLSRGQGDERTAAVFSTMQHATTFLSKAQELGHYVKLDYIFPADGSRLAVDFPDHQFRLDPSPESFF